MNDTQNNNFINDNGSENGSPHESCCCNEKHHEETTHDEHCCKSHKEHCHEHHEKCHDDCDCNDYKHEHENCTCDADSCHDHSCGCEHRHGHSHGHHGCNCGEYKIPKALDVILIIVGFVLAVVGFAMLAKGDKAVSDICFIGAYCAFGVNVFYGLVRQLMNGSFFSENMLMTVASVGAIAISETMEGMLVMMLFRIGEMLEHNAENRAQKNIGDLLKLKPKTVRVKQSDGKFKVSSPENLVPGDIIIVKPGEIIGADGNVVSGTGEVNTSSITGESLPIAVGKGDSVLFGYTNINSPLEICVAKSYADGTFSKIITALKENLEKKSKSETFISKFAKVYTPIVMLLALAVFVSGGVLTGDFKTWLYRALVFLAVSCPCALVISVPLTFFVGLGFLSKKGLLLKGSGFVEKLANCRLCVFDKTGTLTDGVLTVSGVEACDGFTAQDVMTLAFAAEKNSNHPVATAITGEAEKYNLSKNVVTECEEIPGKGMCAVVDGNTVYCGNAEILKLANVENVTPDNNFSGVYVVKENTLAGRIFISDYVRATAPSLISGLKTRGIKTAILTGDRGASVERCTQTLNPDEVYSGLLPHEKSEKLEELMQKNDKKATTLYLGDGINDAPVIARADVGIAMGMGGAEVTIETADGILMNNKPEVLIAATDMSKKIVKRAKINIFIAFAIKLAVLVLGALGHADMLLAMLADVGVLIVVVINSLRRYNIND